MGAIMYNIPHVAEEALLFDDYDFSNVYTYSDLKVRRIDLSLGFNFKMRETHALVGAFAVSDYDDQAPYLYDTTGRYFFARAGLTYSF